ncbi:8-amino-7-oxononanoate synthase [Catenovulum adriaticum]|uniref:8-amino-7-ketopelargonate synthase n=1 Tax=Catenovulum adriaticum TaxID=2984846 RepID=A0ABY7AQ03_9ALTE|nr:8-amino-7-oxononanoate synthase [Catenovulum sp. TS8]WAJ71400.1 8-amino-7-oxononanoate synthase [Catenovulum sp. TS8]
MLPERLAKALVDKKRAHSFRERKICQPNGKYVQVQNNQYLNFSGNDYLAIASSEEIKVAYRQLNTGSTGSALINGYNPEHAELELQVADWLGFEKALLYSTGFAANSAVIKTVMSEKNGLILQDKLNHASLIDGGLTANAKSMRFAHNDMVQLETKLKRANYQHPEKLIVSEGIFSMDGDNAPIASLSDLASHYDAGLMIDDAHGIGVLGTDGRGSLAENNLKPKQIDIYMATFGKALGSAGAVVCGNATLIEYLVNFSRDYIYSTSMSPHQAKLTSIAIELVKKQQWRRDKLIENIAYFKQQLANLGFADTGSNSAIQPIIVGENQATLKIAEQLKKAGIWLTAIRPPTVAKGSARLRVTLSTAHNLADIRYLSTQLANAVKVELR